MVINGVIQTITEKSIIVQNVLQHSDLSDIIYTTSALSDQIEPFLRGFKENGEYKYMGLINQMMPEGKTWVEIDYMDLNKHNLDLAIQLTEKPDDVIQAFNESVYTVLRSIHYDYAEEIKDKIRTRIGNFQIQKGLREVDAEVINKMITVPAMVVRTSEVRPLAKKLVYRCRDCDTESEAMIRGSVIVIPAKCNECNSKEIIPIEELSEFNNFQLIRLQELPEELPAGQLPHYVEVVVLEDLVDECRPGDRVLLTGIVRIESEKYGQKTVFKLHMEGNNIERLAGLDGEENIAELSQEDKAKIQDIAKNPNAIETLVSSFAPHIYGYETIKESILLLIVGSVTKKMEDGTKKRGDINIFLVGDPGTAKSEMLKFASKIVPRGIYTSGKGSSGVGLTAAVVHDKSGMLMLETGAVVLGDQGTVCIDEFDKMKDEDRAALHECMEQQTCSVAKGGIIATLNARTSILAAANPNGGKYDTTVNVVENVKPIPIPLLTRFDIIHIMRDIEDEEKDSRIASHVLDIHTDSKKVQGAINIDLLRKYIVYAKKIEPKLGKEARQVLNDYYMKMRKIRSDAMTVTVRQLDGLVRLATARARLLLKDTVDKEDAERAVYMYNYTLESLGIDIESGKPTETKKKSKDEIFKDLLEELLNLNDNRVQEMAIVHRLIGEHGWTEDEAQKMIRKYSDEGKIYEYTSGIWCKI